MFVICAVVALVLTPFLEYAWHAWLAHGRRPHPTRTTHLDHHAHASESVVPWIEIRENAPRILVTLTVVGVLFALVTGVRGALGFDAGLVLGYLGVTLGHARMHQRPPRGAFEEWMWRFHFHHHFGNARKNYGLTTPIFDFIFRTAEVPDVVEISEGALPAWFSGEHRGFRVRPRKTARA